MTTDAGPRENQLDSGRSYAFINVMTGAPLTVDPDTNTVVGRTRYAGTPFQVWEATSTNGLWTFKNTETGRYLGHNLDVIIEEHEIIKATTHPFTWRVERDAKGWAKLWVPFTRLVLDMEIGQGRRTIMSCISHDRSNQKWILSPDIESKLPIIPGDLYRIVSSFAGTVLHLEASGAVSGHEYNEGRNQKWEAIPSGTGTWFLRNHFTGRYLGIEGDVATNEKSFLVGIDQPFAWDITRKYIDGEPCKREGVLLRVPSTLLAPHLLAWGKAPGTKVHLYHHEEQYWVFEKVQHP